MRMGWMVIIGSIPIGVLGLLFEEQIDHSLRNLYITATMLIVFGVILGIADHIGKQVRDLEDLNVLHTCLDGASDFTRVLVTEPEHPYLEAWWPQGHVLGWENAFSNQARDLLVAIRDGHKAPYSPDFAEGLALQRVLDAIIASDAADGATVAL